MSVPLTISTNTALVQALTQHQYNMQDVQQQHLLRRQSILQLLGDLEQQDVQQLHERFAVGLSQQFPATVILPLSAPVQMHQDALPLSGQTESSCSSNPQLPALQRIEEYSAGRVPLLLDTGTGDQKDRLYPDILVASSSRDMQRWRVLQNRRRESRRRLLRGPGAVARSRSGRTEDDARSLRRLIAAQAAAETNISERIRDMRQLYDMVQLLR